MKTIFLLILLAGITACGKGGGGGSAPSDGRRSDNVRVYCDMNVPKGNLLEIAASSNKVRRVCNLTEDEVVRFIAK